MPRQRHELEPLQPPVEEQITIHERDTAHLDSGEAGALLMSDREGREAPSRGTGENKTRLSDGEAVT
jgi:hypothetical protein